MINYKPATNPYLTLYTNSNVKVPHSTEKITAEQISTHITLMHNALGHLINDLIQILAKNFINTTNNLIQMNN
jgi:hypothetical protein